jgi:tetratricopeptide (TPR) repeat protein
MVSRHQDDPRPLAGPIPATPGVSRSGSLDYRSCPPVRPSELETLHLNATCLPILLLCWMACPAPMNPALGQPLAASQADQELEELLALERGEADRLRRRGDFAEARRLLGGHLRDEEEDSASRALLARVYFDEAEWGRAEDHAGRAYDDAMSVAQRVGAGRVWVELLLELGRSAEAEALLRRFEGDLSPDMDARDALLLAEVRQAMGEAEAAGVLLNKGRSARATTWEQHLARARCLRALGDLEGAAAAVVAADRVAREGEGEEPDVLAELGSIYFEADREVAEGASRSASKMYDEALALNPSHEGALLGLFELHRTNYHRQRRSASEFLSRALEVRPQSIEARLAACSSNLTVGKLPSVRAGLVQLEQLAGGRREVRTLRAALAWVQHERELCEQILAQLAKERPGDSRPERVVGQHLIELYRFAEALPFVERAVERDSSDYEAWTLLGRARANTGDEPGALEALRRSEAEGGKRQDAWRKNTRVVLERLERDYVTDEFGALSFAWRPDAEAVLRTYLEPFYREAREELAARYGFTPEPTHIEVFRHHEDFSVRSTGFQGFPALGVCFGPVVTALSPLAEMRGSFSWARTSFHEFTHVIHLGLSHNRCPRWITEGLATWEEKTKNPAWDRNMRRELIDARANASVIPVRDLNAAFRGPRIIFGYYQGGLTCEMLIERFGFPPVIRMLEAFDRGLDLDQALREVYDLAPEQLDALLLTFIDRKLEGLAMEPRWESSMLTQVRFRIARNLPDDAEGREDWQTDWCTLAWGAWQAGREVDAQEALRRVRQAGPEPPRALFLRGEMALAAKETSEAIELWEAAFAAGGEDFRARVALGSLLMSRGDRQEAEAHLLAAEACFPGFADPELCAEYKLVALYTADGREDEAMAAAERYLAFDAGEYTWRRRVAAWHAEHDRFEPAARLLEEANEVDPFARALHRDWADALFALGRHAEALREFEVAAKVPAELDLDRPGPLGDRERAQLLAGEGRCLVALGRVEEARARLEEATPLAPELPELETLAGELP